MVMFWPIQQELDCINREGRILGKIKFDGNTDAYIFSPDNDTLVLSDLEANNITEKLSALNSGLSSVPMQDDD